MDANEKNEIDVDQIRENLRKEMDMLNMRLQLKMTNSPEYKRILEISNQLNIKMVALSKEEQKQEFEEATKLITESEFEGIINSYGDEKKYVQVLKGYRGYDNEWKLYTRINVNCFNYYFHKAKFILRNYYKDYQHCMNLQYKGNAKFLDPNMKVHYDMVKSNKKISSMSHEEFLFRLENVRLLYNAYEIPELAEYTELIHLHAFWTIKKSRAFNSTQ